MRRRARHPSSLTWLLVLYLCALLAAPLPVGYAQVTPKAVNTRIVETTRSGLDLGTRTTQITEPATNITTTTITGGTRPGSGTNLFHSFDFFTVGSKDIAHFLNNHQLPTTNIIARVIGDALGLREASTIDGILRTNNPLNPTDPLNFGSANLYLINPAGIIFGPNARLDLKGSFAATTADYLRLSDGTRFHADPAQPTALSVAPVAAFGFTAPRPVAISIQGSTLQVASNQTLSVIGGDLTLAGGSLLAPSGRIDLASAASAGEVIPNATASPPDLHVESFSELGRIALSQGVLVDAGGDNGGTIVVRGSHLALNGSGLFASTKGPAVGGAIEEPGAGIDIRVSGNVALDNVSVIGTNVFQNVAPGVGSGGVRLKADHVEIANSSDIESVVFLGSTGGKSGDVVIDANSVLIRDLGFIRVNTGGSADGGDLILNAKETLELRNGGLAFTLAFAGSGNAGDIVVNANDILLAGAPGVITGITSQTGTIGNAGNVSVTAQSLRLLGNATFISTPTFGPGQGGTLDVNVAGDLFMSGTAANPFNTGLFANTFGTGKAGNLNISADSVAFVNYARGQAATFGPGDAGNVTVHTGSLELRDGSTLAASAIRGTGRGGAVDVTANTILIAGISNSIDPITSRDFTGISTATNVGPGGDIRITANNLTVADKSQINSVSVGPGTAGNITLQISDALELTNGGQIISNAAGSGPGGNIEITAGENLLITGVNPSPIIDPQLGQPVLMASGIGSQYVSAAQGGSAGNIQITTANLEVLDGGRVSVSTFGPGTGGDITVIADRVRVSGLNEILQDFLTGQGFDPRAAGSSIESNTESAVFGSAVTGAGGSIRIQANDIQVADQGFISAQTSSLGDGGSIELSATHVLISGGGFVSAESAGPGDAGSITFNVNNLLATTGGEISSSSTSTGDAGSITIQGIASPAAAVSLTSSSILTQAQGTGAGGSIDIDATTLTLDRSTISASVKDVPEGDNPAEGVADITLRAPTLQMTGGTVTAETSGTRNAGSITLNVGTLTAQNNAQISSSSTGVDLNGDGKLDAQHDRLATGNAGSVTIQGLASPADSVSLTNSAVLTSAAGTGAGGSITVDTRNLALTNATVSASVKDVPEGGDPATGLGNITLTASQETTLSDGTVISAESTGTRNAGTVTIRAGQNFFVTNSRVTTEALNTSGGNINLFANQMLRLTNSGVTTSVFGPEGTAGGDIFIDPQFVILQSSQILAQATEGRGGNINILAGLFLADPNSRVSATSQRGVSGEVNIQSPIQNLSGALVPLRQDFLQGSELLAQRCAARMADAQTSTFVVVEHEGLPREPGGVLPSSLEESQASVTEQHQIEPIIVAAVSEPFSTAPAREQVPISLLDHTCRR